MTQQGQNMSQCVTIDGKTLFVHLLVISVFLKDKLKLPNYNITVTINKPVGKIFFFIFVFIYLVSINFYSNT
jgi:hypothetical protein